MKIFNYLMIAALGVSANAFAAGERIDQTREASATGTVSIESMAGEVRISAWNRNEVRVEGELDDKAERLEFSGRDGFTIIKVVYPRRVRDVHGSDLNIHVPEGSRIEIETVSAEIDIEGVKGSVRAESVSGDIMVESPSSEYTLETVSGSVRLKGSAENARIRTGSVSGDLRLSDVNGEVEAESVSGDIAIDRSSVSRLTASNTSGDIQFAGSVSDSGIYRFETISGDVTLDFDGEPSGDFDISTFSGDIDNEFGPEPERTSKYTPGKELNFRLGEGSASYRVETLSGEISLRK